MSRRQVARSRPRGYALRLTVAMTLGSLSLQSLHSLQFVGRASPPRGLSPLLAFERTAAEEKAVSDEMDKVLKRRLSKGQEEDELEQQATELSTSAREAVDAATGGKEAKAKSEAKVQAEEVARQSGKIVKSLNEVLASTEEDEPGKLTLRPRQDIYKEMDISRKEVQAYWARREENKESFYGKVQISAVYPLIAIIFPVVLFWVIDDFVHPLTDADLQGSVDPTSADEGWKPSFQPFPKRDRTSY